MDVLKSIVRQAKQREGRVIFPEGDEERTLEAAVRLAADGVCTAVVVGKQKSDIERTAQQKKLDISGIRMVLPSCDQINTDVLRQFVAQRMNKGVSEQEANEQAIEPLYFAALYARSGGADSMVAGARADTADVLRAAIHGIGIGREARSISSFFLMIPPPGHPVAKGPFLYADCAVNPDPSAVGLGEIARATIESFRMLFPGKSARVAFLSFSTKGSADHPVLQKVRQAVQSTQKRYSSNATVMVDGELQFDAAVLPQIAERKAPGSPVGGEANIFIFPDLNSGNICYKITERLALFKAIGPVVQGTAIPVSDLSRGCSVDDIYNAAAVTLLQSAKGT